MLILAQTSASPLPWAFWLAPAGVLAALVTARVFASSVLRKSEGDAEMVRIASAVRQGAIAYLRRQYRVVTIVFLSLFVVLGVLSMGLRLQPGWAMIGVPIAGFLSGMCGWFGMKMATSASARTTWAARQSLNAGLTIAFRSGAVMGMLVVGFALLDVSLWFLLFRIAGEKFGLSGDLREITTVMLSFAMGASTQALFARVGGGIFTKAADVGADLVGKVEAGIPEDDPRNPAVIADNVGDNVGDVAGMGADLYESYYGSILSTLALGAAAAYSMGNDPEAQGALAMKLTALPLALAGVGIMASVVGVFAVRVRENATFAQLLASLRLGVYVASALIVGASFALPWMVLGPECTSPHWWGVGVSIVAGLASGLLIARATEYATSYEHAPTRRIAQQALTGPATVIIGGIAEGLRSTWLCLLSVVVAILVAFVGCGGSTSFLMGLYGIGIAAVGMLSTLGITLATDAYGPIADNAGGNAEMSGQDPLVRHRTDLLDSLGNTTAATGKGFAIGSAALTALALLAAYVQVVQTQMVEQAGAHADSSVLYANSGVTAETIDKMGSHVVYQGHGLFTLIVPNVYGENDPRGDSRGRHVDCGVVVEHSQEDTAAMDWLPVGSMFEPLPVGSDQLTFAPRVLIKRMVTDLTPDKRPATLTLSMMRHAPLSEILAFYDITLTSPRVMAGLFLGVLVTFLFCALTMAAVGRAAYAMMGECRRQFGIMRQTLRASGMTEAQVRNMACWPKTIEADGNTYPDHATCVSIATAGAQREMVVPSLLAIAVPLVVAMVLGVSGVVGLLAGGLTSGFALAIFMANAGGAWDNAKKLIESCGRITAEQFASDASLREKVPLEIREAIAARAEEYLRTDRAGAAVYGKGSDDHKAAVVGDTVGDPFKDTSGPSLNILIKLLSIVSVVFAGLAVRYGHIVAEWLGI